MEPCAFERSAPKNQRQEKRCRRAESLNVRSLCAIITELPTFTAESERSNSEPFRAAHRETFRSEDCEHITALEAAVGAT